MKVPALLIASLLLFPVALASPQSHGYSWIMDMEGAQPPSNVWEEVDYSSMKGGATEMLFVRYVGTDNGSMLFDFFGGNLVDISMHIEGKNRSGAYRTLDYRLFSDMNYSGRLIVNEITYFPPASNESYRYYGIKEIFANVSGTLDLSISDSREGGWTYEEQKKSNISIGDFHALFSPYLPFYPSELRNWSMASHLNIRYWGNRSGFIDYRAQYPDGKDDSLKAYVGKRIGGYDGVDIYARFFSNGTMFAPSILGINEIVDMEPYEGHMRDFDDIAFSMDFWQRYNSTGIIAIAQSSPTGSMVWSENVSMEEVIDYLSHKSSYMPGTEEERVEGTTDIMLYLSVILISVSLIVLFYYITKRFRS